MKDREKRLRQALEGMTRRFPGFYDDEVESRLITDKSLPSREKMLLAALVEIVDGCLDRYEDGFAWFIDRWRALDKWPATPPAAAEAVALLADFGLMKVYSAGSCDLGDSDDRVLGYGEMILVRSADDDAPAALAELGLTTVGLAEWTETGKRFLAEEMREWRAWKQQVEAEANRKRQIAAKFVNWTNEAAFVVFMVVLFLSFV
jgi:hypothetical protein